MKKAFTMIELIFIIVIIGILSVIAIPKLTATRTDAKVSSVLANLRQVSIDCKSFFSAKGEREWINAQVNLVTNVPLYKDNKCEEKANDGTTFVGNLIYICDDDESIIKFDANNTHLTVKKGSSSSPIAQDVYSSNVFKSLSTPNGIRLGGINVVR